MSWPQRNPVEVLPPYLPMDAPGAEDEGFGGGISTFLSQGLRAIAEVVQTIFNAFCQLIKGIFACFFGGEGTSILTSPIRRLFQKPPSIEDLNLPLQYRKHQNTVDEQVMREFAEKNPQNPHFAAQRKKMILIQALLENPSITPQSLGFNDFSQRDLRICQEMRVIAEAVRREKGHLPRPNQILSVLLLLEGDEASFAQISTGQGKTLIAFMRAALAWKVDRERAFVLTTTEPLALSGYEETQRLFQAVGMRTSYFDGHNFLGPSNSEVVYLSYFSFSSDKANFKRTGRQSLNLWPTQNFQPRRACLIADECDYGLYKHVSHRIQTTMDIPFANEIKQIAWEIASETKKFCPLKKKSKAENDQFKRSLIQRIKSKPPYTTHGDIRPYVNEELDQWIEHALEVMPMIDNPGWKDGERYRKIPSIQEDLTGVLNDLTQLSRTHQDIQNRVNVRTGQLSMGKTLIGQGNDLLQSLRALRAGNRTQISQELSNYMRSLTIALRNSMITKSQDPQGIYKEQRKRIRNLYLKISQIPVENTLSMESLQILNENRICYIEEGTSQLVHKMKFHDLIHLFLEYKEFGQFVSTPSTALYLQSQIDAFNGPHIRVVGFTGSLPLQGTKYNHFMKIASPIYNRGRGAPKMCVIPDFIQNRKRTENPIRFVNNQRGWENAIAQDIRQRSQNQAILVVCNSPGRAEEMREILERNGIHPEGVYQTQADQSLTETHYRAGQVVITTALGARGTDWHVNAPEGFHVLCTYQPDDDLEEIQISGRAARSGQNGSFRIISNQEGNIRSLSASQRIRNANREIQEACQNDLVSNFYQTFSNEIQARYRNRATQEQLIKQLVLWMSMRSTKTSIQTAIDLWVASRCSNPNCFNGVINSFHQLFMYQINDQNGQIKAEISNKVKTNAQNWGAVMLQVLDATR